MSEPEDIAAIHALKRGTVQDKYLDKDTAMARLKDRMSVNFSNVRKAFQKIDEDRSGYVSIHEFRGLLNRWGIHMDDTEFGKLASVFDADGDGSIDYPEFVASFGKSISATEVGGIGVGMQASAEGPRRTRQRKINVVKMSAVEVDKRLHDKIAAQWSNVGRAFRNIDEDKSGRLSLLEFRGLLDRWGFSMEDAEFEKLSAKYDVDNDGDIDYKEFLLAFGATIAGKEDGALEIAPGTVSSVTWDPMMSAPYDVGMGANATPRSEFSFTGTGTTEPSETSSVRSVASLTSSIHRARARQAAAEAAYRSMGGSSAITPKSQRSSTPFAQSSAGGRAATSFKAAYGSNASGAGRQPTARRRERLLHLHKSVQGPSRAEMLEKKKAQMQRRGGQRRAAAGSAVVGGMQPTGARSGESIHEELARLRAENASLMR